MHFVLPGLRNHAAAWRLHKEGDSWRMTMQLRWLALLALWTLLIGPVMDAAPVGAKVRSDRAHARSVELKKIGR